MKKELLLSAAFAVTTIFAGIPLPEHPRPDWERAEWLNLNGQWEFARADRSWNVPKSFPEHITVPFGWGAPLSGVKYDGAVGWYRRVVKIPADWKGARTFLVIGACDWQTTCWINGNRIDTHDGGYTPFEFELTDLVGKGEEAEIVLRVFDPAGGEAGSGPYLYGKQGYGEVRGIWQTVYLESRGDQYLESVHLRPDLKGACAHATVRLAAPAKSDFKATIEVDGRVTEVPFSPGETVRQVIVPMPNAKVWDLDHPNLYDVVCRASDDTVKTYFGMREIGVGKTPAGNGCVTLNGKPIYLQLCLDQSYHPEGFYTFPSDEYMKNEILISKQLALSGNRVHIKVEVPRKLYWADKLGLLIQADVPNAWGDVSTAMFDIHRACLDAMIKRDFNHPCIYQWTLFNETWGLHSNRSLKKGLAAGNGGKKRVYRQWAQRKVAEIYAHAKEADPTRLVEDQSACNHDHVISDVNSWHAYCPGYNWFGQVEYWCNHTAKGRTDNYIDGNVQRGEPMMNSECGNVWGYHGSTGDCDFTWDYHRMIEAFRTHPKCCGWLYTEHHDVINEWNGYVRFDRTWKETGIEELFPGMRFKDFHADAYLPLDRELCRVFAPGATWKIPVKLSLTTDRHAGKKPTLGYFLRYADTEGKMTQTAEIPVSADLGALSPWRSGPLAEVAVALPDAVACGTICFTLKANGEAIARNFACFATRNGEPAKVVPSASSWRGGTKTVMDGAKVNGFGTGWFEFTFQAPAKACTFFAEVSAKRPNGKDRPDKVAEGDLDWMLGGGSRDRSKNPNSYPQTSTVHKWDGSVRVYANGVLVKSMALPDDPADHRGILSWHAQKQDGRLSEAGSYGWPLLASIPADALAKGKDGKLVIRLEGDRGLAVYGEGFGRYPAGPHLR